MSKGEECFQLTRCGLVATHPNVEDTMILKKGHTSFGRHSSQDFFLDSKKYEKLISRRHAEIQRTGNGKNSVFTLTDKSLNGTFVNDVRVAGSIVLKLGDVVMFGHLNGINIKPGERGPQHKSEFKFTFERTESLPDVVQSTSEKKGEKKRKSGSGVPVDKKKKKTEEPEVEWSTGEEPCAAPHCLKPVGSLVNWVQCDDCDNWFHTECMKVDLSALGENEYRCGC